MKLENLIKKSVERMEDEKKYYDTLIEAKNRKVCKVACTDKTHTFLDYQGSMVGGRIAEMVKEATGKHCDCFGGYQLWKCIVCGQEAIESYGGGKKYLLTKEQYEKLRI